jgi:hypothetical protein
MADVLGAISFLETPDVNGSLVLTTNTGMSAVTGTANQISITGTLPALGVALADNIAMPGASHAIIPIGSTAERPSIPVVGMMRYNSDLDVVEAYDPFVWKRFTGIIDKSVVTQTVTTNATTAIVNYTVPGGVLGTNKLLRIRLSGTWNNTSGATRTVTLSIRYGGTTMWADTSATIASGVTVGWSMDLIVAANNSAAAQTVHGIIHIGGTGAVTTGITGDLASDEITGLAVLTGTAAVNSAVNQDLVINTAFNGANITWNKYYHFIEVL